VRRRNISAWNYPWFVGSNVFVPALLAGNTVLYKPSEFASLTGAEIARLLYEAGIPQDVVHPGDRRRQGGRGAARAAGGRRLLHRLGRRPASASPQAVAGRMIKLQLELGGKDPIYVCDDVEIGKAAAGSPTARSTTPARAAARSSASTSRRASSTRSSRLHGRGAQVPPRRPARRTLPTSGRSRARRS
jgi:acyl-CoA reductase-like NAD-dependent aldehyde dehydrogenase